MTRLCTFIASVLSSDRPESYTRVAGLSTLYAYLCWATYMISGGATIAQIDLPVNLALFLASLYGIGEYFKTKGGGS